MEAALKALQAYNIKGAVTEIAPFGLGYINDSYLVKADGHQYLLQKLNQGVFQSPETVESNLSALLDYGADLFVKHYKTNYDKYHCQSADDYWRLMDFMEDAYAPETAINLKEVERVAEGFGKFISFSSQLNPEDYRESIPKFHDLKWRLEELKSATGNDQANRLNLCKDLVEKTVNFDWIHAKMDRLISEGLPGRVCHNDTKLNNCLISKSDHEFKYIIDLDTIGPGYVLFDFGDLVRTTVSPTSENELDESKIEVRKEFLEALHHEFIAQTRSVLKKIEIDSILFGGLYMTYIMAVRFLTDYLNGDTYYKTSFENENFIRARNQLRLLELLNEL